MTFTYLASPYTHPDPAILEQRFKAVCKKAAELMRAGEVIFCPIAHSHPIAEHLGNHIDGTFWQAQDAPYVALCSKLYVLMLPGWENSRGTAHAPDRSSVYR